MNNDAGARLCVFTSSAWKDYALLDSGDGKRLEEFGAYKLIRPDKQAIWKPGLSSNEWSSAHAEFIAGGGEKGGWWQFREQTPHFWTIKYRDLVLGVQVDESRNVGVFPEQAANWDWLTEQIMSVSDPVNILNLFAYTGIASLTAAQAGASVTHVDASKRMIHLGRENQNRSGLSKRPIRWIVDDVIKFVKREHRRGRKYEGILMDPPRFGRGPKGETWEVLKMLPMLLEECVKILSPEPLLFLITAYAAPISAITLGNLLRDNLHDYSGFVTAGEMGIIEKSLGRTLPTAVSARWSKLSDS